MLHITSGATEKIEELGEDSITATSSITVGDKDSVPAEETSPEVGIKEHRLDDIAVHEREDVLVESLADGQGDEHEEAPTDSMVIVNSAEKDPDNRDGNVDENPTETESLKDVTAVFQIIREPVEPVKENLNTRDGNVDEISTETESLRIINECIMGTPAKEHDVENPTESWEIFTESLKRVTVVSQSGDKLQPDSYESNHSTAFE